jgi:group I intron endonuclease
MKHYFIYILTCATNQKVYVGASQDPVRRLKEHRHAARHGVDRLLYRAMRKYGVDSFHLDIIYGSSNRTHIFEEMEPHFIRLHKSDSEGYNLTKGGDGGNTVELLNEEQRLQRANKISQKLKGRTFSDEHCQRISEAAKKRGFGGSTPGSMSEEGRRHISEAVKKHMTGRTVSKETREKLRRTHTGVTFNEERRRAISEAKKGKPAWNKGLPGHIPSTETRAKMSVAQTGKYRAPYARKPHSEETRQKMSAFAKGKPSPLRGRMFTEERRKKQSEAIRLWHRRKFTSE